MTARESANSGPDKSQILKDFDYLVKHGWRQVGPMARREVQMWNHQMLPYTYDGLITGEAMRVQKRYEKEGRVTKSIGGAKVPCCGHRYYPKPDERDHFDFKARGSDYLVCVLQVGHTDDHIAGAIGFETKEWDEWRWEKPTDPVELVRQGLEAPGKERNMASAYEATVQLYRNDDGVSIVTDATTLDAFNASIAKIDTSGFSEYDKGKFYVQVEEIACKLKGYKSEVMERRLLIAGQSMPSPVDLRFTTGPGLPSVEISANGQEAAV